MSLLEYLAVFAVESGIPIDVGLQISLRIIHEFKSNFTFLCEEYYFISQCAHSQ